MITNYNNLPLKKWYQIKDVLEGDYDIDQQIKVLSIITDIPEDDLFNMKLDRYEKQLEALTFLTEPVKPKSSIPNKILINGKRYRIMKNVDKMTAGQYIDIQTYYKENLGYEYILSTLVIPEDCKRYCEGYEIDDVIKDIMEIDIQTAIDVCFFFSEKIAEFNKNYPNLFGLDDKDDKDSTEEGRTDEDSQDAENQTFTVKWNLMHLVDIVSDTMKMDWYKVYDIPIVEFLNTVCYYNDKVKYIEEQNKLWRMKN